MLKNGLLSTFIFLLNVFFSLQCPDILDSYDYIIVGSGSAGSAIAARLSEDPDTNVLLLEAGGKPLPESFVPLTSYKVLDTEMDWQFHSTPQKTICGIFKEERCPAPVGKALGGSSSINTMIYQRPMREDLDEWESFGNPGWGYDENFKYLLKIEDYQAPHTAEEKSFHVQGGPITASTARFQSEISIAILRAATELGYNITDVNGPNPLGFSFMHSTTRDGSRCSAYVGYLKPIEDIRSNLKILIHSQVTKILFDENKKAIGINFVWQSEICTATASKEVIVSAGTFNSPKLLMLSGIGPQEQLAKLNIPLVQDLPGVGENLQDHLLAANYIYNLNRPTGLNIVREGSCANRLRWNRYKTGPFTSNWACEVYAFVKVPYRNDTLSSVGELLFCGGSVGQSLTKHEKPELVSSLAKQNSEVMNIIPVLLKPKSRGTVTLQSDNPFDPPLIDYRALSDPDDEEVFLQIIKKAIAVSETSEFKKYLAAVQPASLSSNCPGSVHSDEYIHCGIHLATTNLFHPTGTCKMGPPTDPLAVVDNRLRVYGVHGLRVADASIMPEIVGSHPNIPCMMIGEKLADMIKEDAAIKEDDD